ncbi:hypothetical protein DESPIG_01897 [Desulfovibrio piger ATCC 29098]|uniref:Uncharacterized protein n=1 Tax=Desulfovibrio piger ATCC 29098 TaxID=411464 RepID=B6WUY3_9BACT|nr:hypothetical protein DESPIG_01897 [Desulfovibrio piger ATCC 29098]
MQHGCVKSAGPGWSLTLRGMVAGEAPGTRPSQGHGPAVREMSHDGAVFPAKPVATFLITRAGEGGAFEERGPPPPTVHIF